MAADSLTTTHDDLELEAAGYQRYMPRRFSVWSLAALSFTLTCTWLGTGSSIGIALNEASAAGVLWSLTIAGVMTTIVAAGMAELASAYPVSRCLDLLHRKAYCFRFVLIFICVVIRLLEHNTIGLLWLPEMNTSHFCHSCEYFFSASVCINAQQYCICVFQIHC